MYHNGALVYSKEMGRVNWDFRAMELAIGDNFRSLYLGGSRGILSPSFSQNPMSSCFIVYLSVISLWFIGLSVEMTEVQIFEWEDLRTRLRIDDSDNFLPMDDDVKMDILTCNHCLLYHSDLALSDHSTCGATINVHMFLLNDFCLITSCKDAPTPGRGKELAVEYVVKYAFPLDELAYREVFIPIGSYNSKGNSKLRVNELEFELEHQGVCYTLRTGSQQEKNRWIEELRLAIFSIYVQAPEEPSIGWPFHVESTTFLASAFFGDDDLCRYYLNDDRSLANNVFSCGMCALHWAAFNDKKSIIKLILDEYGANVDSVNNAKNTALHLAAARGHTGAVQVLLDHQARL